jgi:hypothetical protein
MSFIGMIVEGIVSGLSSAISYVVMSVFAPLVAPFIEIVLSLFKGVGSSLVNVLIEFVIMAIDLLLEYLGAKMWMVNQMIENIQGITKFASQGTFIDMLKYTPLNYFANGLPEYRVGNTVYTDIHGRLADISEKIDILQDNGIKPHVVSENDTQNPYFFGLAVMKQAIMPTALTIFALIVMIELFQIATKTEGMRNSGFEAPFKLMFKVAVCKIILDNTHMILEAIFNSGAELVTKVINVGSSIQMPGAEDSSWNQIRSTLLSFDFIVLLMLFLQLLVESLLFKAVQMILPFLVFGRIMEMQIYLILAPIPFSTLASQELNQIGKNYIKSFISITLKVVVMYLMIIVYTLLMHLVSFDFTNMAALNVMKNVMIRFLAKGAYWAAAGVLAAAVGVKPLIFAIMLLMSLMTSDKFTNRVCGSMW